MDYTVHGILQARILEWVAVPFSRGSSQPTEQTQVSHIAGGFFTIWAPREAHNILRGQGKPSSILEGNWRCKCFLEEQDCKVEMKKKNKTGKQIWIF